MRNTARTALLATAILLFYCGSSIAGLMTLGAKASVYNPPEPGANPSLMYGFFLDYEINEYLHARTDASYTSYTAEGIDYTLMPITANLIAHFMPGSSVDPYIGGGLGYYSKTADGVETAKTGAQGIAGLRFTVGGLTAALEVTYIVSDLGHSEDASVSWGGWATGTTSVWIPF